MFDADLTILDIGSIDEGDFYVKFQLRNKVDGFHWVLICSLWGLHKWNTRHISFLTELVQTCAKETGPALVGGY